MQFSWADAIRNTGVNKTSCRFPAKDDRRVDTLVHPYVKPRFAIDRNKPIFTIGSCFAREIEEKLTDFDLPTRGFSVPATEWPYRPNGLLNEYNPGTISQRIGLTIDGQQASEETIVAVGSNYVDLLLPGGAALPLARIRERRAEIAAIYARLPEAACVIITLGLIESWFDTQTNTYLNRMPPLDVLRQSGDRYAIRIIDMTQAMALLDGALGRLDALGKKVVLTVSPVPLQTTFSGLDAVIANGMSKSVLRVCAQTLAQTYANIDYFPSYEMVTSCGFDAFEADNVHVRSAIVDRVTAHMMTSYIPVERADAA